MHIQFMYNIKNFYTHTDYCPLGSPATVLALVDIDIFDNCNWAVTQWQYYSKRLHTDNP